MRPATTGVPSPLCGAGSILVLLFAAADGVAHAGPAPESHLPELTAITVGSFSTIEQARRDARYGVAESEIVRIWPERTDGVWLYQEQALLGDSAATRDDAMKDKPYFLRVIHSVETAPGVVTRTVHRLEDPSKALGAWRTKAMGRAHV